MSRYMCFVILLLLLLQSKVCVSQQKILLIGTFHRTEKDRLNEITPIAMAVERFNPDIICTEYPLPTDSASLAAKGADRIFEDREAQRKAWNIPTSDIHSRMEMLRQDPHLLSDLTKQIELQQLYYLALDNCNAEYFGYRVMGSLENDPISAAAWRDTYPGFMTMKAVYDTKNGTFPPAYLNNEYYRLVFPLAEKLKQSYLYPIDDLSTWSSFEKYYDRLHVPDSTDVDKMKFRKYEADVKRNLASLPRDSNQWIFFNSPQVIHDLLYVEGYIIDEDISNEDVKMLHYYWVLRNRVMAEHIRDVARQHPDKKIVVFFGVSHVGPVRDELNKLKMGYKVLTLMDVIK